jgi:2'-5' RNA ligase
LFAAIVPPIAVLDHLSHALAATIPPGPARRLVMPRATWHLTCAFYGEVPGGGELDLAAALTALAARTAPLGLNLQGAGCFGGRACWVGVGGDTAAMARLMAGTVAAGAALGFGERPGRERRRSRAHLTISRRGSDPGIRDAVTALSVYSGPAWTASELALIRSDLGAGQGGHPRYTMIGRYPLAG